jgi:endogenous inhibitor of DNA gyrase (YacG/DUF329 family)
VEYDEYQGPFCGHCGRKVYRGESLNVTAMPLVCLKCGEVSVMKWTNVVKTIPAIRKSEKEAGK